MFSMRWRRERTVAKAGRRRARGALGIDRRNVGKKGPGVFAVPGLMKITVQHKPATKPRKGINPFTGQEMMFKAKPARNVVRIRPLKSLKDMVK